MMRPYQFGCDCDGMVSAIRRAATPGRYHGVDPSLDMDPTEQAVWWAKYVMRKARALRLYVDPVELTLAAMTEQRRAS
jgi:hypothetical protein